MKPPGMLLDKLFGWLWSIWSAAVLSFKKQTQELSLEVLEGCCFWVFAVDLLLSFLLTLARSS